MTLEQVAELLQLSPHTIREWAKRGDLPCLRIGRKGLYRFRRDDVETFLSRDFMDTPLFTNDPGEETAA